MKVIVKRLLVASIYGPMNLPTNLYFLSFYWGFVEEMVRDVRDGAGHGYCCLLSPLYLSSEKHRKASETEKHWEIIGRLAWGSHSKYSSNLLYSWHNLNQESTNKYMRASCTGVTVRSEVGSLRETYARLHLIIRYNIQKIWRWAGEGLTGRTYISWRFFTFHIQLSVGKPILFYFS